MQTLLGQNAPRNPPKNYHQPLNSPLTEAGVDGLSALEQSPSDPRLTSSTAPSHGPPSLSAKTL